MIEERLEAVVSDHKVEGEGKRGYITLAEFSLVISDNTAFYVLKAEAVSFSFSKINGLFHILSEVALIILKEDELQVKMRVV